MTSWRDEESLQNENARRITRDLSGTHEPDRRFIIKKMRWRYSKYGRRTGEKKD